MKKIIQILFLALAAFSTQAFAAKILYIGDSHSTAPRAPFGAKMNTLLRSLPDAEVSFHSRCGSTVNWWYTGFVSKCGFFDQGPIGEATGGLSSPTPSVVELLNALTPSMIIVQLGANYMSGPDWSTYAKKDIQKLVDEIQSRKIPCLWVGLPDYRLPANPEEAVLSLKRRNDLIETLRSTVTPVCTYVDSTTMTRYPAVGGDGYHYSAKEGLEAGFAWADQVFHEFVTEIYRQSTANQQP